MPNIRYTKDIIQEAVNRSFTWAEACRQLGIKPATGAQSHLKRRASLFGVEFSHFFSRSESSSRPRPSCRRDVNEYLKLDGPFVNSHYLKVKLIRAGIKEYRCECCTGTEWLGSPIPLELHHADGNRRNNTLENLQVLCANCHSMTPNNSGKANKKLLPA